MSYEHRIYIVKKHPLDFDKETGLIWAEKIAEFDLGYVPMLKEIIRANYSKTDCFIYDPCDNCISCVKIVDDKYGLPLTEIPIKDLLSELLFIIDGSRCDVNVYALIGALRSICKSDFRCYDGNLVCLHYGY